MHPDDVKAIDAYTEIVRREAAKDAEIARLQEQVETLRKELRLVVGQRDFFMKINENNSHRAEAAEAERDRLRDAGARLANAAYNLAQNDAIPTRDRVALKQAQEQWDAALQKEPQL